MYNKTIGALETRVIMDLGPLGRRSWLGFFGLWLLLGSAAAAEPEVQEEEPPPARQNLLLREYFKKQYETVISPQHGPGSAPHNERFMQMYIDRQIDHFLREVKKKLERLRGEWDQARQLQESLAASGQRVSKNSPPVREFAEHLKAVSDSADDLRKMFLMLVRELDSKEDLRHRVTEESRRAYFEREMGYLEEQIRRAEERIRDFLFVPSNVVRLEELQGENMLIYLYRVDKMAKMVRDSL